tara:strand:- start:351 stop:1046 length:696 start_codon:yes stop_codon:yes gene_type:complete
VTKAIDEVQVKETVLSIDQLTLEFPGQAPLATISWTVHLGQQVALLGKSGSGKSTLLTRIIRGSSSIQCQTQRIAYLSQQPALLPWVSVLDNILLGFTLRGETIVSKHLERAHQLLIDVDLCGFQDQKTKYLSGGEKSRVALARALIEDADLLLLDEPFAALDRSTKIHMTQLCNTLFANKTVILVTHDPRDALSWLDTAMVLTSHGLRGPFDLADFQDDHALIQALDGDL